ncbi:hypothetical protein Pfra02_41590 [Pseudomonas fragi]|nr:hypothetical protein Pfra02_41590 [Pseudomonas fragi]
MARKAQSTVEPLHRSLKTQPVRIDIHCWHNGQQNQMRWDLFDRLVRFKTTHNERARKQRELGCGFTSFGRDGDTLGDITGIAT